MSDMANEMANENRPMNMPYANPMAMPCHDPGSMVCDDPPVTTMRPEMVDPISQWQRNYYENVIIPHIHPSHTTHHRHTHFTHAHYFPHTESVSCTTSCSEVMCTPPPCPPCPPRGPFGI